jgi:hypothetical protein
MKIELFKDCDKYDIEVVILKSFKNIEKDTKVVLKKLGFEPKEELTFF